MRGWVARLSRARVVGAAITFACAIWATEASAQKNQGPPNALQGFSQNRNQPVKSKATTLEVRD